MHDKHIKLLVKKTNKETVSKLETPYQKRKKDNSQAGNRRTRCWARIRTAFGSLKSVSVKSIRKEPS